jgi:hypothetical protein
MSEYLDREPIPAPPLPFVVEEEAPLVLFIRRRDGWRYQIQPHLHELPDQYRERVELHCKWFNDTYDYAAREEHRRAQDWRQRKSELDDALEQFGKDVAEIARITQQAAE